MDSRTRYEPATMLACAAWICTNLHLTPAPRGAGMQVSTWANSVPCGASCPPTILRAPDPRARERGMLLSAPEDWRRAAAALLKAGARRPDLVELAGEELLDRAARRLVTLPRFRSILRGGSR